MASDLTTYKYESLFYSLSLPLVVFSFLMVNPILMFFNSFTKKNIF